MANSACIALKRSCSNRVKSTGNRYKSLKPPLSHTFVHDNFRLFLPRGKSKTAAVKGSVTKTGGEMEAARPI